MAEEFTERGVRVALIMGDPEQAREFAFEMSESPEAGTGGVEMVEGAREQVVQVGVRVLGLDGGFEEPAAIGGEKHGRVGLAQALPPMADGNLAQWVKLATPRALEGDFPGEKKVELAGEGAFGATRAACHGFHEPMFLSEPVGDQAGVREFGETDEDGRRGLLHGGKSPESRGFWRWKTEPGRGWRFCERFPGSLRIDASDPFATP